jgi:hypothetical protein
LGGGGLPPTPNPQSPIPNPQSPINLLILNNKIEINKIKYIINILIKNKS